MKRHAVAALMIRTLALAGCTAAPSSPAGGDAGAAATCNDWTGISSQGIHESYLLSDKYHEDLVRMQEDSLAAQDSALRPT